MKRILFVCTSNICRSFLAEYIFKDMLEKADEEGKLNKKDFRISSAGLFAIEDDEAGSPAVKVLEEIYDIEGSERHRAQLLDAELLEDNDLIIAMPVSSLIGSGKYCNSSRQDSNPYKSIIRSNHSQNIT